jgi:hypothetical protein
MQEQDRIFFSKHAIDPDSEIFTADSSDVEWLPDVEMDEFDYVNYDDDALLNLIE